MTAPLRVAFVPGVTPDKWARIWGERHPRSSLEVTMVEEDRQTTVLYDGTADMCFVRLPVDGADLHVIPLYDEAPVVVVPKDHAVTAFDEVSSADLSGEVILATGPELSVRQAIETVAAGTGVVVLPMSVARLHHRKDVSHVPVSDLPETRIGLAWRKDVGDDPRIEELIGIVRGRTERSSRGSAPSGQPTKARPPRRQPSRPRRGRRG